MLMSMQYWLPGFLFTGLSTFAFICWAAPSELLLYGSRIAHN